MRKTFLKIFLKSISLILALLLFWENLVWAEGIGSVAPLLASAKNSPKTFQKPSLPDWIEVKGLFQGTGTGLVILIQDAHANEEAQRRIAGMIDTFSRRYNTRLVFVEGASGEISHHFLSAFPHSKSRRIVADHFLRKAYITGPEYLTITQRPDLTLYGMEEKLLYEANRQAFLTALDFQKKDRKTLRRLRGQMEKLARYVFPQEVLEIILQKYSLEDDPQELIRYIRHLAGLSEKEKIPGDFPQIKAFLQVYEWGKDLDAEKAKQEIKQWARHRPLFKRQGKSRLEYYQNLLEALKSDSRQEEFSVLENYLKYAVARGQINGDIFFEIRRMEQKLKERLIGNEEGRALEKLFRVLEIWERMFDFALTREDAEEFFKNKDKWKITEFHKVLGPLLEKHRFSEKRIVSLKSVERHLPKVEQFYRFAIHRDHALIARALWKMKHERAPVSILVAGGFHTPGLEKKLREKGYSYLVAAPRLKQQIQKSRDSKLYTEGVRSAPMELARALARNFPAGGSEFVHDPRYQLGMPTRFATRETLADLPPPALDAPDYTVLLESPLAFTAVAALMQDGTADYLGQKPSPAVLEKMELLLDESERPWLKLLHSLELLPVKENSPQPVVSRRANRGGRPDGVTTRRKIPEENWQVGKEILSLRFSIISLKSEVRTKDPLQRMNEVLVELEKKKLEFQLEAAKRFVLGFRARFDALRRDIAAMTQDKLVDLSARWKEIQADLEKALEGLEQLKAAAAVEYVRNEAASVISRELNGDPAQSVEPLVVFYEKAFTQLFHLTVPPPGGTADAGAVEAEQAKLQKLREEIKQAGHELEQIRKDVEAYSRERTELDTENDRLEAKRNQVLAEIRKLEEKMAPRQTETETPEEKKEEDNLSPGDWLNKLRRSAEDGETGAALFKAIQEAKSEVRTITPANGKSLMEKFEILQTLRIKYAGIQLVHYMKGEEARLEAMSQALKRLETGQTQDPSDYVRLEEEYTQGKAGRLADVLTAEETREVANHSRILGLLKKIQEDLKQIEDGLSLRVADYESEVERNLERVGGLLKNEEALRETPKSTQWKPLLATVLAFLGTVFSIVFWHWWFSQPSEIIPPQALQEKSPRKAEPEALPVPKDGNKKEAEPKLTLPTKMTVQLPAQSEKPPMVIEKGPTPEEIQKKKMAVQAENNRKIISLQAQIKVLDSKADYAYAQAKDMETRLGGSIRTGLAQWKKIDQFEARVQEILKTFDPSKHPDYAASLQGAGIVVLVENKQSLRQYYDLTKTEAGELVFGPGLENPRLKNPSSAVQSFLKESENRDYYVQPGLETLAGLRKEHQKAYDDAAAHQKQIDAFYQEGQETERKVSELWKRLDELPGGSKIRRPISVEVPASFYQDAKGLGASLLSPGTGKIVLSPAILKAREQGKDLLYVPPGDLLFEFRDTKLESDALQIERELLRNALTEGDPPIPPYRAAYDGIKYKAYLEYIRSNMHRRSSNPQGYTTWSVSNGTDAGSHEHYFDFNVHDETLWGGATRTIRHYAQYGVNAQNLLAEKFWMHHQRVTLKDFRSRGVFVNISSLNAGASVAKGTPAMQIIPADLFAVEIRRPAHEWTDRFRAFAIDPHGRRSEAEIWAVGEPVYVPRGKDSPEIVDASQASQMEWDVVMRLYLRLSSSHSALPKFDVKLLPPARESSPEKNAKSVHETLAEIGERVPVPLVMPEISGAPRFRAKNLSRIEEGQVIGEVDGKEFFKEALRVLQEQKRSHEAALKWLISEGQEGGLSAGMGKLEANIELLKKRIELLDVKAPVTGWLRLNPSAENQPAGSGAKIGDVFPDEAPLSGLRVPRNLQVKIGDVLRVRSLSGARFLGKVQNINDQIPSPAGQDWTGFVEITKMVIFPEPDWEDSAAGLQDHEPVRISIPEKGERGGILQKEFEKARQRSLAAQGARRTVPFPIQPEKDAPRLDLMTRAWLRELAYGNMPAAEPSEPAPAVPAQKKAEAPPIAPTVVPVPAPKAVDEAKAAVEIPAGHYDALLRQVLKESNPHLRQKAADDLLAAWIHQGKLVQNADALVFSGNGDIADTALQKLFEQKEVKEILRIFDKAYREKGEKDFVADKSLFYLERLLQSDERAFRLLVLESLDPVRKNFRQVIENFSLSVLQNRAPHDPLAIQIWTSDLWNDSHLHAWSRNKSLPESLRRQFAARLGLRIASARENNTVLGFAGKASMEGIGNVIDPDRRAKAQHDEKNILADRVMLQNFPYWEKWDLYVHLQNKAQTQKDLAAYDSLAAPELPKVRLYDLKRVKDNHYRDPGLDLRDVLQQRKELEKAAQAKNWLYLARIFSNPDYRRTHGLLVLDLFNADPEGRFYLAELYASTGDRQIQHMIESSRFSKEFFEDARQLIKQPHGSEVFPFAAKRGIAERALIRFHARRASIPEDKRFPLFWPSYLVAGLATRGDLAPLIQGHEEDPRIILIKNEAPEDRALFQTAARRAAEIESKKRSIALWKENYSLRGGVMNVRVVPGPMQTFLNRLEEELDPLRYDTEKFKTLFDEAGEKNFVPAEELASLRQAMDQDHQNIEAGRRDQADVAETGWSVVKYFLWGLAVLSGLWVLYYFWQNWAAPWIAYRKASKVDWTKKDLLNELENKNGKNGNPSKSEVRAPIDLDSPQEVMERWKDLLQKDVFHAQDYSGLVLFAMETVLNEKMIFRAEKLARIRAGWHAEAQMESMGKLYRRVDQSIRRLLWELEANVLASKNPEKYYIATEIVNHIGRLIQIGQYAEKMRSALAMLHAMDQIEYGITWKEFDTVHLTDMWAWAYNRFLYFGIRPPVRFFLWYWQVGIVGRWWFKAELEQAMRYAQQIAPGLYPEETVSQSAQVLKRAFLRHKLDDDESTAKDWQMLRQLYTRTLIGVTVFLPGAAGILSYFGFIVNFWGYLSIGYPVGIAGYLVHLAFTLTMLRVPNNRIRHYTLQSYSEKMEQLKTEIQAVMGASFADAHENEKRWRFSAAEKELSPDLPRKTDIILVTYDSDTRDSEKEKTLRDIFSPYLRLGDSFKKKGEVHLVFMPTGKIGGPGSAYLAEFEMLDKYPDLQRQDPTLPRDPAIINLYVGTWLDQDSYSVFINQLFNGYSRNQDLPAPVERRGPASVFLPAYKDYVGPLFESGDISLTGIVVSMRKVLENRFGLFLPSFGPLGNIFEKPGAQDLTKYMEQVKLPYLHTDRSDLEQLTANTGNVSTWFTSHKAYQAYATLMRKIYYGGEEITTPGGKKMIFPGIRHYSFDPKATKRFSLDLTLNILIPFIKGGKNLYTLLEGLADDGLVQRGSDAYWFFRVELIPLLDQNRELIDKIKIGLNIIPPYQASLQSRRKPKAEIPAVNGRQNRSEIRKAEERQIIRGLDTLEKIRNEEKLRAAFGPASHKSDLIDAALNQIMAGAVQNAADLKFGEAAPGSVRPQGDFIFQFDAAQHSFDFVRKLAAHMPAGTRLIVLADPRKPMTERETLYAEITAALDRDIKASRIFVPKFHLRGWSFESFVAGRLEKLGLSAQDILRVDESGIEAELLKRMPMESIYLAASMLTNRFLVMAGGVPEIGESKALQIAEIMEAVRLIAASA